ncbi:MAG: hypothetical protein KAH38_05745, partial [Candidatus Hydrogenedentes bacterium]|nr:hypothetical protein [Candidatus Hydrogenedentota bacterium]
GQNRMDFGFWGFKDKEWRIRPFYYAYGLFTRFLEAGMTPLQIDVTPTCHDAVFSVLKSEDQRKWRVCALNLSEEKIKITISGLPDLNFEVYAYTADQIPEQGDLFYGKMQAMLKKELWNSSVGILDMPSESLMVLTADAAVCALEITGE